MRLAVLSHRIDGDRRGFALLVRDGMAAWIDAWASCATPPAPEVAGAREPASAWFGSVGAGASEVVSLLASMALSTLQECPS